MLLKLTFLILVSIVALGGCAATLESKREIFDPLFIFCGSRDCYDILGVDRHDNITTISKAYRQLSKTVHPDKVHPDKRVNVTEEFRLITKAHEVLKGNESRTNFDFYLDHPRQYFKATGKHAFRALPKANLGLVIFIVLILLTGVGHVLHIMKYRKDCEVWKERVLAGPQESDSKKDTLMLTTFFEGAARMYKKNINDKATQEEMKNDEQFQNFVGMLVDLDEEVSSGKPKPTDLLIVRVFTVWPHSFVAWFQTYYRRHWSGEQLTPADMEEMARKMISPKVWDELSEEQHKDAILRKVWESEAYDQWVIDTFYTQKAPPPLSNRQKKMMEKQNKFQQTQDKQNRSRPKTD